MLEEILEEAKSIEGVEAVLTASYRADIADYRGKAYTKEQLQELTNRILSTIAVFASKNRKVTEIEYYWQNRYVICKATDRFIVVAVCRSSRVLSLLRITLNVIMARLTEHKKFHKWLKNHLADRNLILNKIAWSEREEKILAKLK